MSVGELIRPTSLLRESFLDALVEFHEVGEQLSLGVEVVLDPVWFGEYTGFLCGEDVRLGSSSMSFWWVEGGLFVGNVIVRNPVGGEVDVYGSVGYTIRPSLRGQGHGGRMLKAVVETVKGLGVEPTLAVFETNVVSLRLAVSAGFTETHRGDGVVHFAYCGGEGALR